jgi:hypothetical protein
MGDSIEQWRAIIGQWNGGRPGKCVTLQHCIAETSNHIGYRPIRFLVLVSLLVIGCVELNPGPNHVRSVTHSNKHLLTCIVSFRRLLIKMKKKQNIKFNFQSAMTSNVF